MSQMSMQLYHRLPSTARSVVATLRGLYLGWWRYGPETDQLIAAALEREHWSPAQWRAWREERLAYLLHRAATRVPYYRQHWQARRSHGDRASWEVLENWPILGKEVLREHSPQFIADDCNPRRMFFQQTSGTTGKPLRLWRTCRTLRNLYAVTAARTRQWYDADRRDRWGRFGGQLVTPIEQRHPPFWVWNAALRQLYLSTYHLAPDLIPSYLDALRDYRIVLLEGYPSSLHVLAQAALQLKRRDLRMKVVITNAEPLMQHQRETIAEAFQCPVQETYGMGESVAGGSSCKAGRLHQWPELGIIEVLDGVDPVGLGNSGDLVCTGLLDADMPLLRYRVGDRGSLSADPSLCGCGRTLPVIEQIEGRSNDMLITRDGRRVFWLNPVFYGIPVRESQVVQDTLDRVRVRFVPAQGFTPEAGREVISRLHSRLGNLEVILEPVAEIPRAANGKLQAIRCDISAEERAAALGQPAAQTTQQLP